MATHEKKSDSSLSGPLDLHVEHGLEPKLADDPLKALTQQERIYVDSYLTHFDGPRAQRESGILELSKPKANMLKAAIRAKLAQWRTNKTWLREKLMRHLAHVAFSDPADFAKLQDGELLLKSFDEIDPELRQAIQGIKITSGKNPRPILQMVDKMKALQLLAQLCGFVDPDPATKIPVSWIQMINMMPIPPSVDAHDSNRVLKQTINAPEELPARNFQTDGVGRTISPVPHEDFEDS